MPAQTSNYDEIRQRIVDGEEAQFVVSTRRWHSAGVISYRTCLEVRLRTESDRWPRRENVLIVGNPDEGSDNALGVVGILHRWLAAIPATPPTEVMADA